MKLEDLLHRLVREFVQQELRGLTIAGVPSSPANDLDHTRDSPMTTAQAARYCGFKTTAAIRKALLDGRLVPLGRRRGNGHVHVVAAGARRVSGRCARWYRPSRTSRCASDQRRTSWKKRSGQNDGGTK